MGRKTKMNSITSPELLAQVNKENKELLQDFLNYLRSIRRSETTILAYQNDLEIAWVWCLQNIDNKPFTLWTKRNIVAYQNWLLNNNQNSPARVRRLKSSLSSLSNFIEAVLDEEFPDFRNIIRKIENPALQPVRDKTVWEDEELESLLDTLVDKKKYDQACYLSLAMCSGRRKAELARFKVSDFDDDKLVCDNALYKSAPIKTKGRGDGKFIPCYTLAKRFKPYFDLWMNYRKEMNIESEWLFPSAENANEHIHTSTFNSWANTFSKMTGKAFYAHSLRHYFTTSLVKAGIPDNVITQIVGWDSADMCKVYTDLDADDQIGMYFKDGDISVPDRHGFADV